MDNKAVDDFNKKRHPERPVWRWEQTIVTRAALVKQGATTSTACYAKRCPLPADGLLTSNSYMVCSSRVTHSMGEAYITQGRRVKVSIRGSDTLPE
jgi:hypothetical protein